MKKVVETAAQLPGPRALTTGPATRRDSRPKGSPPGGSRRGSKLVGDGDLVAALASGVPGRCDVPAPGALLFDRYALHVRRVLVNVLGYDTDVDDLVQEVFARALAGIGRVRDGDQLKAWVARIAVFTARTHIKNKARHRSLFYRSTASLVDTPSEPVDQTKTDPETREAAQATYRVLDRMNADLRIAFVLRFIEGMELKEVATACGKSLATIKRRLRKAQAQFLRLAAGEPSLTLYMADSEPHEVCHA